MDKGCGFTMIKGSSTVALRFEVFHKESGVSLIDILVVRRNRLGDAAITCLVLRQLLSQYKNVRISVITNNYAAPIYREFYLRLTFLRCRRPFGGLFIHHYFNLILENFAQKL